MFQASVACMSDSTAFTDLSIAPGSSVTGWNWNFGDGTPNATIQNPKHKYTTAATFNVTLIVTNLSGCQDSITIPIIVRPKPVAAFAYTSFFCPAGQIAFQDQSTGTGSAIVQREWIFVPGATSSLINPIFTFPVTDTTYLVQLIVTDSYGCMDTIADSVHVKPGFKFTFSNDTVCFKDVTHFYAHDLAQGDSLYNVTWNFGDPTSGPSNNTFGFNSTHTFSQPGVYVVKMKATDSDNCSDSIFHEVTVHALPAPAFTFVSLPCDSLIHFHDGSGSGSGTVASWTWSWGDATPDVIIPGTVGSGDTTHIYAVLGVYPVTLKVTNTFGCSDTIIRNAEYFPCILAGFSYLDTLTCARYSIALSDSSLPINIINQWHWVFGDGSPDTTYTTHAGVIHHTFANPGSYGVQLIIHATVGSGRTFVDTTTQAITIHPTPMPYFSNVSICKKQTTFFRDTSETFGSSTTSWKWNFGESWAGLKDTSSFRNPSFTYDSAGTYNVKMVVMNRFGCKDSVTKATRVFELPTASFDHSIACSGNPTLFTDKSFKADTTLSKWFWNFGEPTANKDTSELQNPSHQYKTEGLYPVKLIVKDKNGCYDTADSSITVHVTPVSSFTYTDNITNMTGKLQFTNKSSGADTYFWDFGNGQTSTEDNPVVTYANDGSFIIMLISNNQYNCTDTTYFKYEFIFKGLYIPNAFAPSSQTSGANVFAPVGVNLKQYKIEVFDNWGHLMWTSTELDALGRPTETWNGKDQNGVLLSSGTFMWKAKATFIDNSEWPGSDIGKGGFKTFGTVTLIR
jgi:PKD repeat protein